MERFAYFILNIEAASYWPVICGQVYFRSYIVALFCVLPCLNMLKLT
jgi:hypothetical protein